MNIIILAAGMGKRMKSDLPKVLHPLAGKSLLSHVVESASTLLNAKIFVVYGHGGEMVPQAFSNRDLVFSRQEQQLGTGHAVMQAAPDLSDEASTLILFGDVPLTKPSSMQKLLDAAGSEKLAVLTVNLPDPTGYGRIVRNNEGGISRIVEQKDASSEELAINEVNTGIMVAPTRHLKKWLGALSNDNAQNEYYLTDIVKMAVANGVPVVSAQPDAAWETLGVNSKVQLAELERIYQRNIANELLEQGATLADPARIDVRGSLTCGRDVYIDVNCVFEGSVTIGDSVTIGANCIIKDADIKTNTHVREFCHIDDAVVGESSVIGPYARLRPGANLGEEVHIGNFVEIKNSKIAAQSKANHLAYVGDSTVGARVNIGAGAITCNYDGANKHQTIIEDDAFIGTNCELVAPVHIGKGATIGAGTTLAKDAPADTLTISRAKQTSLRHWKRPTKIEKSS